MTPADALPPLLPPQGHATSLEDALAEPLIAGATAEATIRLEDLAGMDFRVNPPSGREFVIDLGTDHGGHARGPEPKELLLAALASCTAMDVIAILRKKRQVVTEYRVRVAATEQQEHPRVYTAMVVQHIVGGPALDPAAVARAVELSAVKYCPVSAMLAKACPITHQFRLVP
ncbi:MAG TPA: OsmC family protein [Chloroflexia bacterium]|nr:OsmC family protein [Chloroflexia bacterium]